MSVERVLLENFIADFLCLAVTARYRRRIRFSRLLAASAFGAIWAGGLALLNPPSLWRVLLCLGFTPILCRILCGKNDFSVCGSLLAVSMFLAGALQLFSLLLPHPALAILPATALMALSAKRKTVMRQTEWNCSIQLRHGKCSVVFDALIDTGNRLREPISGLPVLLVEERLLFRIRDVPFRIIPYGGVGGDGILRCFYPDELYLCRDGSRIPLPDIWVALYPKRLPGRHHALAPAEILAYSSK